ncbi:MAG: mannose-1-phosphate guanylyltransferase/mannose-6-phosphate isomerase [Luminiphilus sp.]|nr:mannose-1-phosphate guanylyltransferase/mannose-6-phosphate isomerase [Luminiphilus sp.]
MLIPVLLSGGVGSRLWPVSRAARPKQFLPFGGEGSMLQETQRRLEGLECAPPLVVCNAEHRFMVAEQLRNETTEQATLILEPAGRNTAPAIALAALHVQQSHPKALLLVLPADHHVTDPEAFQRTVVSASERAQSGRLMTFGVVPTKPETGYGYVRCGEAVSEGIYELAEFVEKPDKETAEAYLASGHYYWNSGMFLFRADRYLAELALHRPAMLSACEAAMSSATRDLDFVRPSEEAFLASPSESIDYAVMEHTLEGGVAALDCGWSDVGAWSAMWDISEADAAGNVCEGDVLLQDAHDNYLRSESRLVAAIGVRDLVVVETADAVMVGARDQMQSIKQLVAALESSDRPEATIHQKVFRPWGSYESLVVGEQFQVKRLTVNPGQTLSLQLHHQRAEHWVIVSGEAHVTRGDEHLVLGPDESTYIPIGMKHRLANLGEAPLEVIEVQSGSYLGEDDIVRFDDVYGREETPA